MPYEDSYYSVYVNPSLETCIKNVKTIDLMEVEKEQEQFVPIPTDSQMNPCYNSVKDSGEIDADGEEGNADGYSWKSNLQDKDKDDNKDDEEEEEGESREEDSSSGDESSGSWDMSTITGSSDSSWKGHSWVVQLKIRLNITM